MNGRRRFILSTFLFSIVLFGWQTSPSIFTLRFRVLRRSILTAGVPPPNDGCLFVDKPPPSIFTLRDFVAAFAGLFLRRGCRPSFLYVRLQHYERWAIYIMRDELSTLWEIHFVFWILPPAVYFYRRSDSTVDSFLSLYVSIFNRSYLSTNIRRPSLLPRDFVAASPVHSYGGYARGLFYTVIGWLEIGDIITDGSHYGNNISRHGFHTANKLVNAFKSIKQLKDIDSCKL